MNNELAERGPSRRQYSSLGTCTSLCSNARTPSRQRMGSVVVIGLSSLLLAACVPTVLSQATNSCDSKNITVEATNYADIEGCYKKSTYLTAEGRAVYTNQGGEIFGTTYGILGSAVGARLLTGGWLLGRGYCRI